MKIKSVNPFTEEVVKEFDLLTHDELMKEVDKSRAAFAAWKEVPVKKKSAHIKNLGEVLRAKKMQYGEIITTEMGKPFRDAVAEIEKCAWLCDYYAEKAESFLSPEVVMTEMKKSYVLFEPLGIVLAIMPWNYPFWQAFRFGIPGIIAGNVCMLKHAANVPMSALAIEESFEEAGFPENILKALLIDVQATLSLIDEDRVDAVSLTGSNTAGEQVGALAGKRIKKAVLELGGSDPFVVLEDADIEKAARTALKSRMINGGQSCISAKRFIVVDRIADAFIEYFLDHLNHLRIGNPMDEHTDIGPLAKPDIVKTLKNQIEDAKAKGAEVIQLENPFSRGFFFGPAVVLHPKDDMHVLCEEVFGPIAPIIVVKDEAEAIRRANASPFGLGAAVWSKNLSRAEGVAKKIEAGVVSINDMVKSDPRLPFGGVKKSGLGRELSHYGIREFVNIKTVMVHE